MTERMYTLQIGSGCITMRPGSATELSDCLAAHGILAHGLALYIWDSGCAEWRGERGEMYEA